MIRLSATRPWLLRAAVVAVSAMVLALTLVSNVPLSEAERALVAEVDRIARTGADGSGRVFPLLVKGDGEQWYQPMAVYPPLFLLRIGLPPTLAFRLPSAIAALLTIVLIYLLGVRATGIQPIAALSVLLLLLMPGFVAHAHTAGADLMMVPPILFWLLCVLRYIERPRTWLLLVSGVVLGTSLYTQPAGVLSVPVYLAIGGGVLIARGCDTRMLAVAALGVVLAALPAVVSVWQDPASYPDTFGRWAVHAAHIRDPWQGLIASTAWHVMGRRVGAYWDYMRPTFLFASGTLFTAGMGIPIALGFRGRDDSGHAVGDRLIIAGFLAAPVAAVLLDVSPRASLAILIAPFGALLGARGLAALLAHRRGPVRLAGVALLALLVVGASDLINV